MAHYIKCKYSDGMSPEDYSVIFRNLFEPDGMWAFVNKQEVIPSHEDYCFVNGPGQSGLLKCLVKREDQTSLLVGILDTFRPIITRVLKEDIIELKEEIVIGK